MHLVFYLGLFIGLLCVNTAFSQEQNDCKDSRPDCAGLVRDGLCQTNKQRMIAACPTTCNFCATGPNTGKQCVDRDPSCSIWKRDGACEGDGLFMASWCPRSCQFCGLDLQRLTSKTILNPGFDCGRPYPDRGVGSSGRRIARQTPAARQPGVSDGPQRGSAEPRASNLRVEDAICGATVIHPRYLVTAAHCVLDPEKPVTTVHLGDLDISEVGEDSSRPADYAIESIFVHHDYDPNLIERYNDIALLKTKETIRFNEAVYPFCLAGVRPNPGAVVTAAGFGKVNETFQSPILQEADLNIISLSACEASYRQKGLDGTLRRSYPNLLQGSDVMCAGYPGRGACEGDGGGPLFKEDQDGRRFVVGIISVTTDCKGTGALSLPGIYVSIADHIDFIDSIIYGY